MKVKGEGKKAGLKLTIQKTKIMASDLITSWQIDGERMETVTDFIFLGAKITVDGHCSHEVKRCLVLGRNSMTKKKKERKERNSMTNLDSMLKSRDIILLTKVRIVKVVAFPVVMYGCESWTVKKAEHQRTDALNCSVGEKS